MHALTRYFNLILSSDLLLSAAIQCFKRSTRDSLHSFTVSISQAIVLTKRANEESLNERTTSCKWTHPGGCTS